MIRPSALFALLVVCVLGPAPCFAQESAAADASPPLSAAQLDSLTAPVALYPDALVAQILTAATYPLEVVEAAHWLEDPSNAALRGDALAAVLEHEDWDLSVKSLVPFPDTLRMMERNLQWTEQIGDAFLAQQSDVMDSIQRLRKLAISAGTLKSTPQQTVWNQDNEIVVEPVSPEVVYVPYYNPSIVYGAWPWAEYAPISFPPPQGIYLSGPTVVFGVGFTVIRPLWGWSYWSWPRHGLFIPPHLPHTWPLRPGPWRHDPDHRRGLPYPDRDHRPTQPGHPFPPADLRDRIFRRPGVRRLSILQVLLQDVLQGTLLSRIIRDVEASLHRVERRQLRALGIPAHVRNRRCDHNRQHKHHRQHEPLCHHGCTRRYEGNRRRPVRRAADVLTALPETRHRVS